MAAAGRARLTPQALAAILDGAGARPAPYWPPPPPPGWEPGWKLTDRLEARLAAERQRGGQPDPRAVAWRAYDHEVRACWERRLRLVERALVRARRASATRRCADG